MEASRKSTFVAAEKVICLVSAMMQAQVLNDDTGACDNLSVDTSSLDLPPSAMFAACSDLWSGLTSQLGACFKLRRSKLRGKAPLAPGQAMRTYGYSGFGYMTPSPFAVPQEGVLNAKAIEDQYVNSRHKRRPPALPQHLSFVAEFCNPFVPAAGGSPLHLYGAVA
ncbi:unnamed protein product [Symbiodinium microadriaticum]|nr:unnamed protein product [Symbiodinium microadriaticum]CAE7351951.1 unnamed protein product [Symbiodinium sp. KB8]